MSGFKVVPDSMRGDKRSSGAYAGIVAELRAGKTLFIPLNGKKGAGTRAHLGNLAANNGFKSHTSLREIEGEAGVVAWWDKR